MHFDESRGTGRGLSETERAAQNTALLESYVKRDSSCEAGSVVVECNTLWILRKTFSTRKVEQRDASVSKNTKNRQRRQKNIAKRDTINSHSSDHKTFYASLPSGLFFLLSLRLVVSHTILMQSKTSANDDAIKPSLINETSETLAIPD